MKTGPVIAVILVIILIIIGVVVLISTNKPKQNTQQNTIENIDISNFAFSPQTFTTHVGATIVWKNLGSTTHTITSDLGNELDSQVLSNGQSFSHTFTMPGEYDYHCSFHPGMKGKIIIK